MKEGNKTGYSTNGLEGRSAIGRFRPATQIEEEEGLISTALCEQQKHWNLFLENAMLHWTADREKTLV
jgi:hypothetical protein